MTSRDWGYLANGYYLHTEGMLVLEGVVIDVMWHQLLRHLVPVYISQLIKHIKYRIAGILRRYKCLLIKHNYVHVQQTFILISYAYMYMLQKGCYSTQIKSSKTFLTVIPRKLIPLKYMVTHLQGATDERKSTSFRAFCFVGKKKSIPSPVSLIRVARVWARCFNNSCSR